MCLLNSCPRYSYSVSPRYALPMTRWLCPDFACGVHKCAHTLRHFCQHCVHQQHPRLPPHQAHQHVACERACTKRDVLSRLLARPAVTVSRNASVNALLRAQVITEVLHLSRNPEVVRQIADEKEKAFQRLRAGPAARGAPRLRPVATNARQPRGARRFRPQLVPGTHRPV